MHKLNLDLILSLKFPHTGDTESLGRCANIFVSAGVKKGADSIFLLANKKIYPQPPAAVDVDVSTVDVDVSAVTASQGAFFIYKN